MEKELNVTIEGDKTYKVKYGTTIEDLVISLNKNNSIIAAVVNNDAVSLSYAIKNDLNIKLIDKTNKIGAKIYRTGLKFLYITAVKSLYGIKANVELKHSLDKGIYSELNIDVNNEVVNNIINKMKEISSKNIRINKITTTRQEAIKYFRAVNEIEKANKYTQMTDDIIILYELMGYYNYFYTVLPTHTGILDKFNLRLLPDNGVLLEYPSTYNNEIPEFTPIDKELEVFKDYGEWSNKLNIKYVSDVNNYVIKSKIREFIQLNEIKQNNDLVKIAYDVYNMKDKIKFILLAGPSSSGKTTSCSKLSLYLKNFGLSTFLISTDDFFLERKETKKDENGNYEYDNPEAIDIDLFNEKLTDLMNGKETKLPTYNFITGEKEYKKPPVKLSENDIILIEGIHTLNDDLTSSIPREKKYKIYISPFTPLSLDRHNHISTVDIRFIRRLVRDYRTRGYTAEETLNNWRKVRESEEKFIFPYVLQADVILDTAVIYELGVLKTYAIPLLYSVDYSSGYYPEAIRIINFLKYFMDIPVDLLPTTALLREFVGGGYFE